MAVNANNIEIGAGSLSISVNGGAFFDVGATRGANIEITPEYKDIECDQYKDPVTSFHLRTRGTITVNMLEQTTKNLVTMLGLDPAVDLQTNASQEYFEFGGTFTPSYCELKYTVAQTADTTMDIVWWLYRARSTNGLTVAHSKDEERLFEAAFTLFADSTRSYKVGKYVKELT